MALGAAIACPDRKVVHLQADGCGMYTVQALWSMAREKADVVIVLLKNDAYAILGLELARVRGGDMNARAKTMLDLGNPAMGLGEDAHRSRRPGDTGYIGGRVPSGVRGCPRRQGAAADRVPGRRSERLGRAGRLHSQEPLRLCSAGIWVKPVQSVLQACKADEYREHL